MSERQHDKYDALIARCKALPATPCAVAHPCDESSLRGAVEAAQLGLILPILVGPSARIAAVAAQFKIDISAFEVVDAPHSAASAETAVRLAREGKAEMLMKGSLHSDEIMAAVVKRETGLRTSRRVSHCFIMDVPAIDRVVIITDAAVNIFPTLEDKVHIVQNAIDLAHALGMAQPKVAILSAMETINPKVPSTIEAAALCKMAERGQITGGVLDGPLALDNAIDLGAAKIKKISSPVAGQADILVVPDLEAGNMLAKSLSFMADADAAGIVLGARVPIILTSRADSVSTRLASCAVAALVAKCAAREPAADGGVMSEAIAVLNAGSSSIKFSLFRGADLELVVRGQAEAIHTDAALRREGSGRRHRLDPVLGRRHPARPRRCAAAHRGLRAGAARPSATRGHRAPRRARRAPATPNRCASTARCWKTWRSSFRSPRCTSPTT